MKTGPTKRERLEHWLILSDLPFVAVKLAQRQLFGNTKLESFDFIVYPQDRPNWLIKIQPRNAKTEEGMADWQKVFGTNFQVVWAYESSGWWTFKDNSGREIRLT